MTNAIIKTLWDSRLWHGPAPKVILLLAVVNIAVLRWKSSMVEEKHANLTVGDVKALNQSARYDYTFGEDLLASWGSIPDATKQPLVVLSGMSQMYAINEPKPGDQRISEWLDDRLSLRGVRVYGLAAPNLCNEEALFLLLALLERPQTTPRSFIYGVCFDKFRNMDLRPGYIKFFLANPHLATVWKQVAEEQGERYPLAAEKMLKTFHDLHIEEDHDRPMSGTCENRLRDLIGAGVPVVAERKYLNGFIQNRLYTLRNSLLGIKNTSKRPIIRARYDMNRQFLELMMDISKQAGVQFIAYIIPLNPCAENPYILQEYKEFKTWLEDLAAARRVPFANLENLVPTEEWGMWMGGPDFKHFKGAGHRRVATKLEEEFGPLLTASTDLEAAP
jgi:hypothetical protein